MAQQGRQEYSPQMRQRYGLDRNPWPARIIVGAVIVAFAAVLVLFAVRLTSQPIEARLLVWQQPQPDRLDITFEMNRPEGLAVACVLRAQDADRVDVGYATVSVPGGPGYVQQTYSMRVIAPAGTVEILGCGEAGEQLRVPPPAFPPGVVPPEQPWSPAR